MKKLNIAIVGLGNIGSYLYNFLKKKTEIYKKNNVIPNVVCVCQKILKKESFTVPKNGKEL